MLWDFSIIVLQYKDFTTDPENFPAAEMKKFIDTLHNNKQHFGEFLTKSLSINLRRSHAFIPRTVVVVLDPAISATKGYKPYDDGLRMNIFIKVKTLCTLPHHSIVHFLLMPGSELRCLHREGVARKHDIYRLHKSTNHWILVTSGKSNCQHAKMNTLNSTPDLSNNNSKHNINCYIHRC